MDNLRQAARDSLVKNPGIVPTDALPAASAASKKCPLDELWQNVSSQDHSTHLSICESLVAVTGYLEVWDTLLPNDGGPRPLNQVETKAVNHLFSWASAVALPSSEFAIEFDETAGSSDDVIQSQSESRFRSELAVGLLLTLHKTLPNLSTGKPDNVPEVLLVGASFDNEANPWVTANSHAAVLSFIDLWTPGNTDDNTFWAAIDSILKDTIRPLFTDTKNPAITSAGRKNLHPQTLPRFGSTGLNEPKRPWKSTDIYVASVLSWIMSKYSPKHKAQFEAHFVLLMPSILAMIDDSNLYFKTQGCLLLAQLLQVIQENGSDIIRRTNLTSVFEEAVAPCLLSIPTITPEDKSLKLLRAAYPALLKTLKTAYKGNSPSPEDQKSFTTCLTNLLRSNLISSFHHISSSSPALGSTTASFPYPELSTFLLEQIANFADELGINTIKCLQELVPVLYTTLANPFGTAYPPLLLAATAATQAVIRNAHPRIGHWRGEFLGGLSLCWLHIATDDSKQSAPQLTKLKSELRQTAKLLKHVLQHPNPEMSDTFQLEAKQDIQKELEDLIKADAELRSLYD